MIKITKIITEEVYEFCLLINESICSIYIRSDGIIDIEGTSFVRRTFALPLLIKLSRLGVAILLNATSLLNCLLSTDRWQLRMVLSFFFFHYSFLMLLLLNKFLQSQVRINLRFGSHWRFLSCYCQRKLS